MGSLTKKLEDQLSENCKIRNSIKKDYFGQIAGDAFRLQKSKFKQFIALKYGLCLAEKLQQVIDFNGPVDY
jgi:hypothetical protein